MRQFNISHTIRFFPGRAILCLFLIFCNTAAWSQSDEDSVEVVAEPPAEVDYSDTDGEGSRKKEHFFEKTEEDSFAVNERRLPAAYAAGMKKDKNFWYADTDFSGKKKKEKDDRRGTAYVPLSQRPWFQTLLWMVIIGAFAAAIMWYLMDSNVGLFRKKNAGATAGSGEDEIPEDIFAINYQKEIDKAAAQGNYRLAIRLLFLRLLKSLSDKNIIQYKQDRTNLDYLMHLHPTRYYPSFFRLTRHYEYSWYGLFDVPEDAYKIIYSEFNRFETETV
ncbi:MAG: hypothetical protein ACT4OJ_05080 [Bacteroidota bacterium]